jgi:uncharacterized protein with HEPN domain
MYISDLEHDEFIHSEITSDAVLMQLINLGERMGSLSESFKLEYLYLPYKEAKAIRNIITHQYDGVNRNTIWNTVSNVIPLLKTQLSQIIENLSK